jgi:uncharacterized protein (DUF2267 family)
MLNAKDAAMQYDDLLARVRANTGLNETLVVETAVRAVTEALGALLDREHREALAIHLPEPLRPMLSRHEPDPEAGGADFLRRVAATEHLPRGFAVEHATAVLEALGSELEPSIRRTVAARLPEEMREWIEPRRMSMKGARPRRETAPANGSRLSDGKPGSAHPVSEASPAQADSVAATGEPHASTRLSSGPPRSEGHDLAEGRPGSEHPVSESR